jgi:hypothetical protein
MSYSRFQIGFTSNRKVYNLSNAAFRLYVTSIDWSRGQKTDGRIARQDLRLLPHAPKGKRAEKLIGELLEAGLWEGLLDGWQIHDFLEWQDSAVQANERARRARERMREVRSNCRQALARTDEQRSLEVRDGPSDPSPISLSLSALPDLPEKPGSAGAREGSAKKPRRAVMVRMPEPFDVTEKHLDYAKSKGWPVWWVRNRHEQFCDLAVSKGWLYADWDRAFYTFLRGEIGYRRGPDDLAHLASGPGSRQDAGSAPAMDTAGRARLERLEAQARAEHEVAARELGQRGAVKAPAGPAAVRKLTEGIGG